MRRILSHAIAAPGDFTLSVERFLLHLVGQRQRHNRAVEKWIYMTGRGTWVAEDRDGVCAVNIFVTPARNEKAAAGGDDDVVSEKRTPFETSAAIEREIVARVIGEQDELGRFRCDRANVVHVDEAFQLRQNIGVEAITENQRARINEVGLAFRFAGAEIDHQTVALFKIYCGAGEVESLVREETERSADEKWPVEHGVESGRFIVLRVRIAARVEDRQLVAHPIFVD